MDISYIASTRVYSGVTSSELSDVTLPLTLTKYHTVLAFIVCHDINLTPTVSNDWVLLSNTNGNSGSTFLYISQPTGTTINPHYSITGLSNQLNTVVVMLLSGCTYHSSKVVNAIISKDNVTGTGSNGFNTTVDNTMIIQFIGLFSNANINGYSSTPSLVWSERTDSGFTHLTYTNHISTATSNLVLKDKYINFDYSFTGSSTQESIVTVVSLVPRKGNVSMTMCSL
jgi:hypothetical protein